MVDLCSPSPPLRAHSKILLSKQKIIDLFPRIEKTLESIKDADNTVMLMQIKRQKEFWHLLKIACVSLTLCHSEGGAVIEYSRLSSLLVMPSFLVQVNYDEKIGC